MRKNISKPCMFLALCGIQDNFWSHLLFTVHTHLSPYILPAIVVVNFYTLSEVKLDIFYSFWK